MRSLKLFAAALAAFFSIGFAGAAMAGEVEARAFAAQMADTTLHVLRDASLDGVAKQQQLEQIFSRNVDLDWVGRFVLGRHWRTASEQQQQAYLGYYKVFIVRNFTGNLTDYANQNYQIKQVRADGATGEYLLTMEVKSPNEPPIYMDYRLREAEGGFKIFDIIIEGVSLITTQRSEFNAVVEREGIDYLITALGKRAQQS